MKILNELEYAKKLLEKGFTKSVSLGEMVILAKYFRHLGRYDDEVENDLISFCSEHVLEFSEVIYADYIEKAVRISKKYLLRLPVFVPVTNDEIIKIKDIKNYRYEKVLFIMLVLGKYYKLTNTSSKNKSKEYYIPFNNQTIYRLAHVSVKKDENIINYLFKNGFIDNNRRTDAYFLKFTSIEDYSGSALIVNDINNIIDFYPPHCDICGRDLEKKSNRQSLCSDCWKEHRKKWDRNRKRVKNSTFRTMY